MAGFIHDKLDIKLLVLYIMDHVSAPIDFDTLTDLAMCDSGVDYFQFAEAVSELTGSGHLEQQEDVYAVTDRGRRAGAAGESSLSPVIRQRCDRRLAPLNQALKRKAQVRAQVEEQPLGRCPCPWTTTRAVSFPSPCWPPPRRTPSGWLSVISPIRIGFTMRCWGSCWQTVRRLNTIDHPGLSPL